MSFMEAQRQIAGYMKLKEIEVEMKTPGIL